MAERAMDGEGCDYGADEAAADRAPHNAAVAVESHPIVSRVDTVRGLCSHALLWVGRCRHTLLCHYTHHRVVPGVHCVHRKLADPQYGPVQSDSKATVWPILMTNAYSDIVNDLNRMI